MAPDGNQLKQGGTRRCQRVLLQKLAKIVLWLDYVMVPVPVPATDTGNEPIYLVVGYNNLCQIIQLLFSWNYYSRLITNLKR